RGPRRRRGGTQPYQTRERTRAHSADHRESERQRPQQGQSARHQTEQAEPGDVQPERLGQAQKAPVEDEIARLGDGHYFLPNPSCVRDRSTVAVASALSRNRSAPSPAAITPKIVAAAHA